MKLQVMNTTFLNEELLEEKFNNMMNEGDAVNIKSGNFTFTDTRGIVEQFQAIRDYYGLSKYEIWQLTLSGKTTVEKCKRTAKSLTQKLGERFQVVYTLHHNNTCADFIMNSISFYDGARYDGNFERDCADLDITVCTAINNALVNEENGI